MISPPRVRNNRYVGAAGDRALYDRVACHPPPGEPPVSTVTTRTPGCIIFVVDQSASMRDRAGVVADAINQFLRELVTECEKGEEKPRHYFDVGLIGYTTDAAGNPVVTPAFVGELAGRPLVGIPELYDHALIERRVRKTIQDDGAGGLTEADVEIRVPVWYRPPDPGQMAGRPTCAALTKVHDILVRWIESHPYSVPPVVIHLTGGEPTDGNPEAVARQIGELQTAGGRVPLLNGHLAGGAATAPVLFPHDESQLSGDYGRVLFRVSSRLPEPFRAAAERRGHAVAPGAVGLAFNAGRDELTALLSLALPPPVGTAPVEIVLRGSPMRGTPPSPPRAAERPPEPAPPRVDENVRFAVYRPQVVRPAEWYTMLAFAHLAERPDDAPPDQPDPEEQVRRQVKQLLGAQAKDYQPATRDARQGIPRGGELTFLPEVPGVEFNPPQRRFLWQEAVHREEFRLRAGTELDGQTAKGRMTVFLGGILVADVPLTLRVSAAHRPASAADLEPGGSARRYRKIFASYSHKDLEVVRQFEAFMRTLGDEYLRDWTHLRTGEVWNDRLFELIREADVFQLFWSWNAMHSPFVRQEWEYALSLNRPNFVRPTYWEDPMPASAPDGLPPPELTRIQFQRLHAGSAADQHVTRSRTIHCKQCGATVNFAPADAGGDVYCPACGRLCRVPATELQEADTAPNAPLPGARPRPQAPPEDMLVGSPSGGTGMSAPLPPPPPSRGPVVVACPNCGQQMQMPGDATGRYRCMRCKGAFQVAAGVAQPAPESRPVPRAAPPPAASARPAPPPARPSAAPPRMEEPDLPDRMPPPRAPSWQAAPPPPRAAARKARPMGVLVVAALLVAVAVGVFTLMCGKRPDPAPPADPPKGEAVSPRAEVAPPPREVHRGGAP